MLLYTLSKIDEISNDGFTLELPETTIEIVNRIAGIVGSANYVKTPVFHKKSKNKNKEPKEPITPMPVVERSDMENNIRELQSLLNKLSPQNYEKVEEKIVELITKFKTVMTDEEYSIVVSMIFQTATTNRTASKCYANLYIKLMELCEEMKDKFNNNLDKYLDGFNRDFVTVDADKDYEQFCLINLQNEKRRGISKFFTELFNVGLVENSRFEEILLDLCDLLFTSCKEENKKTACEEIAENLFILLTNMIDYNKIDSKDIMQKLINIKDLKKSEYNPSFSPKVKFKLMDIFDKYNN